ncbi:MAG TPA: pyridoxal-phosphate dependent enzyme [Steroidobacteraceae bacterium]
MSFTSDVLGLSLSDFQSAARRVAPATVVTPLLPLARADGAVRFKAENLQPQGSFKLRAAVNTLGTLSDAELRDGVVTASAGNFGRGLAYAARLRGIPITVHVPDTAPRGKIDALTELGAQVVLQPFAAWWTVMTERGVAGQRGRFIHPVCEVPVIAGNGTIALEIAAQWPEADTVVVPFGGGGMCSGIALAFAALGRSVEVIACEIETSTPLRSALNAGGPVTVTRGPSWVDGIGSTSVLPQMWPIVSTLVHDSMVVSHQDAAAAIRLLAREAHLVVEGAAAVAAAAAMGSRLAGRNVVAVLSGGNIDMPVLARLLNDAPA